MLRPMRNALLHALAISAALAASATQAAAQSGLAGSAHDLAMTSTGSQGDAAAYQSCALCHAPALDTASTDQHWSRSSVRQSFTLYTSPTMNAGRPAALGPSSIACLSCHDGMIATASTGGTPYVRHSRLRDGGRTPLGTDLSDDHPVGIAIDAQYRARDPDIKDPSIWGLPLVNGQLECTTCHDPHNRGAAGMLRVSMDRSALCLRCHDK